MAIRFDKPTLPPGDILVVQTAFIGDIVLTTPLLEVLRRWFPARRIVLLTTPDGAAVLDGIGTVDEFIVYDKRAAEGERGSFRALIRRVRAEGFGVAISPHRSERTALLLAFARIPFRVGFSHSYLFFLFHRWARRDRSLHEVDRILQITTAFGPKVPVGSVEPRLPVSDEAHTRVRSELKRRGVTGPYFVCAPGSVWRTKRWDADRFAALVNRLSEHYGIPGVLVGGRGDLPVVEEMSRDLSGQRTADLTGRTTLPELIATIAEASFLVGNDSAPTHVAGAVGTPVVTVFGPTVPAQGYAPYGGRSRIVEHPDLNCRPCGRHGHNKCPRGHFRCMRDIEVETVADAVTGLVPPAEIVER